MKLESLSDGLDKFAREFSGYLEWVGVIGFLLMFMVNLVDVVGAKVFTMPLRGSVELISFSQIVAMAPAVAFTLVLGRHIRVDFIVDRFPRRIRAAIGVISSAVSLLLFILILWQSYLYGASLQKSGEIGSTSFLPLFPFAYLIAFCSIPVCLVFLVEVLRSLNEVFTHGSR
jgi:TRAP-type C4-dicarboxylate transport system permease small subunit